MDDHPMQKLRRINKEKDFGMGPEKEEIPKTSRQQSRIVPAVPPVWACVRFSPPE